MLLKTGKGQLVTEIDKKIAIEITHINNVKNTALRLIPYWALFTTTGPLMSEINAREMSLACS